jgi:sarcosine oxidase subunit alpha
MFNWAGEIWKDRNYYLLLFRVFMLSCFRDKNFLGLPHRRMRVGDHRMDSDDKFEIEVDGKTIFACSGQTIAEALLANGVRTLRMTRKQAPRGVYCGMGICYECRMTVNGIPNVRTCMTLATPGCRITTQDDSRITFEK